MKEKERKNEILKAFLNYKHYINHHNVSSKEHKKRQQKNESKWRTSYCLINEGWITASMVDEKFHRLIDKHQHQYLSKRLAKYFDEAKKPIHYKNITSKKSYRLKREIKIFNELFKIFYRRNEIWEFLISDYFVDCYNNIPFFQERCYLYFISRINEIKKTSEPNYHRYPSCLNYFDGVCISPSMLYFIIDNGINDLQHSMDELAKMQEEIYNDLCFEGIQLKIELAFWLQDYIMAPNKELQVYFDGAKITFNPKKFIENIIKQLYLAEKEIHATFGKNKVQEIKIYGGLSRISGNTPI